MDWSPPYAAGRSSHTVDVLRTDDGTLLVDDYRSVSNYGRSEVDREGFTHRSVEWFVDMFCASHRCAPDAEVTRIEFEYV